MQRLTLSEFIVTIAILLGLALGASQLLQAWLNDVASETRVNMQRQIW